MPAIYPHLTGGSAPEPTFAMTTTVIDDISQIVLHGTVQTRDLDRFFRHTATLTSFTQGWVIDWSQTVLAIRPYKLISSTRITRRPVAHILRVDQVPLFHRYFEACAAQGLRREYFLDAQTAHDWVNASMLDRCERAA